jgi:predicted acylesterase/phospholipase RssA
MVVEQISRDAQDCRKPELPGQVVLVLQGGGALSAYQVGVYEALHAAGIEPDWVIGTSMGAINGAIIASNAANSHKRDERLHSSNSRRRVQSVARFGHAAMKACWRPTKLRPARKPAASTTKHPMESAPNQEASLGRRPKFSCSWSGTTGSPG